MTVALRLQNGVTNRYVLATTAVFRSRDSDLLRLGGQGMESRWEARLSAPIQTDSEAHPTSYTMGTGSFPGVKSGPDVALTTHRIYYRG